MDKKEYRRNCLNKCLSFLFIITGLVLVFLYIVDKHSETEMILPDLDGSTALPLMSVNIKWQDSTYCVVLEEDEILSILKEDDKNAIPQINLPHKDLIRLSYKDTLIVDSLSFILLKDYTVIPQHRIDSIYKRGGVKGLLDACFDDVWFIPYYEESLLTLLEQRYAINILQRHGYTIVIDCESGCLYIREP